MQGQVAGQLAGQSPEEVEAALRQVLARPEFREQDSALAELFNDFLEWLGDLFGGGPDVSAENVASGAEILLWIVGTIATVVVLWALFTIGRPRFEDWRSRRRAGGQQLLIIQRVDQLRGEARAAEVAGDWTRALRLHFFAAVVGLGERGDLDYRDAWTNRELLERGEPTERVRDALAPLVEELDQRSFGLRETGASDVQRFSHVCDDLIGDSAA